MATACRHPKVRIVSRHEDTEYVECLECGEVFDSEEFRDMEIEDTAETEDSSGRLLKRLAGRLLYFAHGAVGCRCACAARDYPCVMQARDHGQHDRGVQRHLRQTTTQ